jgi:hypothetical protein
VQLSQEIRALFEQVTPSGVPDAAALQAYLERRCGSVTVGTQGVSVELEEDAGELSRSGLCKQIDTAIYNWCSAAEPPYSALVFGYPLDREPALARAVAELSERMCTPLVSADDALVMARDMERTGWPLDPYRPDPRAARFTAWSLLRYLFMLHCHYRARREGLDERMQIWLDMHATQRKKADPTRPLLVATATLEPGNVVHLQATPQPPVGVAERMVEARAKLPYVAE